MKKIMLLLLAIVALPAFADYNFIVPQSAGGGTDVWARIVATEMEKHLGEKINIINIPGINDEPGFNKFHDTLQKDDKTVMVAHGGNAESYLLHNVKYDYFQYTPIGLQNLSIVLGYKGDPYTGIKFAKGSGMNPDAMALTMLVCGPGKTVNQYAACFKEKITYVNGMKGNDRRMAYLRGELNVTRESTAAYIKHAMGVEGNVTWFSHGVLDIKTGKIVEDSNFPDKSFEKAFITKWSVSPSGEFYDSYVLAKSYRDVLQKSLWVRKDNPNAEKLREALTLVLNDPNSVKEIEKNTGKYDWIIGNDVYDALKYLKKNTTKKSLQNLVWWNNNMYGEECIYKPDLVK